MRIRNDKDFESATSLPELMQMVQEFEKVKPLLFRPVEEFKKVRKEIDYNNLADRPPEGIHRKEDETDMFSSKKAKLENMAIPEKDIPERNSCNTNKNDSRKDAQPKVVHKIGPPKKKAPTQIKTFRKLDSHTIELQMEDYQNFNEHITKVFEEMGNMEKHMGNGIKHKAYMKAATALQL